MGVSLQRPGWQHQVNVTGQSAQFTDDANTAAESADGRNGRIPGWALLNWRSAWEQTLSDGRTLQFAFGARNLLDRAHFGRSTDSNGGKLAGAPRTAFIEAGLRM